MPDIVMYLDPRTGEISFYLEGSPPDSMKDLRRIGVCEIPVAIEMDTPVLSIVRHRPVDRRPELDPPA